MKKWVVLIASAIVVVSFQNCGKPQLQNESSIIQPSASETSQFNKFSTEGVKNMTMWDGDRTRFLDLDLGTGVMVAVENYGDDQSGSTHYCLSESKKSEINSILQDSEICEPVEKSKSEKNEVCTMIYTYPYAILSADGIEVRLGERTDGCQKPVDLCGAKAQLLKEKVQNLLQNLNQYSCQK